MSADKLSENTQAHTDAMAARYLRADQVGALVAYNLHVSPIWIEGHESFWYAREFEFGTSYRLVDAASGKNQPAFCAQDLAQALGQVSGETVDEYQLPITLINLKLQPTRVTFQAFSNTWLFDEERKTCEAIESEASERAISPNGEKAVLVRENNLWLRDIQTGTERALTEDGEAYNVYAGASTAYGRQETPSLQVLWSPDSSRVLTHRIDTRQVDRMRTLVEHVPQDGTLRPRLINEDRRVGVLGDEHIECYQFLSVEVSSGIIHNAEYPPCPSFYPPYIGYFSSNRGWWGDDSRHVYFIDLMRGGHTVRLLAFDTHTGNTRIVIEECSDAHLNIVPDSHMTPILKPLLETDEVIWYSERSGWAHLYLYDVKTGQLKNTITEGDWLVRNILHYDASRREIYIQTAERHPGRNPYYRDICRVNIDTRELTQLLSSNDDYMVCDKSDSGTFFAGNGQAVGVSPSGNYLVATRTRVDKPSETLLLDRDGTIIQSLETAEVPNLPSGWQWPEPVMLKAADDKTDLYGVVFRPSDFSPDKCYPVLERSWGFATPTASFNSPMFYQSPAADAELGFIVVMITTRGYNQRSRAFHRDKTSSLLFSSRIEDTVVGIQQLAQRFPYMDLNRVGFGNNVSSSTAISGLFRYPDFFKVGICFNPYLDTRIISEMAATYFSVGVDPEKDIGLEIYEQAKNLKGKLLLIHGMLNEPAPLAGTLRIVEALQQADKDFDMLFLPNLGHEPSVYADRRARDYLVKHLQGPELPDEFVLTTGMDISIK